MYDDIPSTVARLSELLTELEAYKLVNAPHELLDDINRCVIALDIMTRYQQHMNIE